MHHSDGVFCIYPAAAALLVHLFYRNSTELHRLPACKPP